MHSSSDQLTGYRKTALARSENSTNYLTKFSDVTILPQHAPNRANDGR